MSDALTVTYTPEEMAILMQAFRVGIKQLMGEEALMKVLESRKPPETGMRMSAMIGGEAQKALALYFRHEELHHNTEVQREKRVERSVPTITERVAPDSFIDKLTVIEESTPPSYIGQRVKYIGEKCGLLPGRIYKVMDSSVQDAGVFLKVNDGYHRLMDFDLTLAIVKDDVVKYVGSDPAVGDERDFIVKEIKHWAGIPYVSIATRNNVALSYPMNEFRLLEDGIDEASWEQPIKT